MIVSLPFLAGERPNPDHYQEVNEVTSKNAPTQLRARAFTQRTAGSHGGRTIAKWSHSSACLMLYPIHRIGKPFPRANPSMPRAPSHGRPIIMAQITGT